MTTTTNADMKPQAATGGYEQQGAMNNGGGPEPHQGSNPGAQSDPGPKEVGFYDAMGDHMGGDDGVQNAEERPSPMRAGMGEPVQSFESTPAVRGASQGGSAVDTQMDGPNDPRTPATYPYDTHRGTLAVA